jgi:glutamate dehydrogenase
VRVNTDAIDNSAGVDTSDHEVNIKIPLTAMTRSGDLTVKQRNALLASMTDEVARQVLRDNYEQNVLLGNARAQDHSMLPVHQRFIRWLEDRGELDRALEFLPSDTELARRHDAGIGLKSPEFSVLVAYAKLALKKDLLPTGLPDEPWFQKTLTAYFPEQMRTSYAAELGGHPLRREIITNAVVNSMVNRGGITFAYRASEETGATPEQVARAFVVCREIFDLPSYVATVELLDNKVGTELQTALYLEFRRLLDRSVRWVLQNRPPTLDVGAEVARFGPVLAALGPQIPTLLQGGEQARIRRRASELREAGAPEDVALRAAGLLDQFSLLDVVEICADTGRDAEEVAPVYFALSDRFGIDAMLTRVTKLPRDDRWDALARAALRDDLYVVLESLTTAVLQSTDPGSTPPQRVAEWARDNVESLSRASAALAGIERLENPGIAALSVALRTLRGVIRSGTATV